MPDILFPPGRMIGGNLDKLFPVIDKATKAQKIGKDGLPMFSCSVGCAIPKGPETSWMQTPWGKVIYDTGAAAHPNLVASPAFSWKITDGDSQVPNKKGKRPCDQAGHPGNWVIWFSQGWLPKRVNANGNVELPEGSIVAGFYIQVYGSVAGNRLVPDGTPGVYLNPIAVALVGEGDRINTDVDTTSVGFGGAPLPAGARPVTLAEPAFAGAASPAVAQTGMPPGYQPSGPTPPTPPVGVQPAPSFLLPPAPVAHQMTPTAQATYEAYIAAGWTDAQLIANGLMIA